jgi:hypothetical protein
VARESILSTWQTYVCNIDLIFPVVLGCPAALTLLRGSGRPTTSLGPSFAWYRVLLPW